MRHKVALIALLRPLQYFQPELAYIQAPIITDSNLRRTLSVRITSQSMATLYRLPLIDPSLLVQSHSERDPTGSTSADNTVCKTKGASGSQDTELSATQTVRLIEGSYKLRLVISTDLAYSAALWGLRFRLVLCRQASR